MIYIRYFLNTFQCGGTIISPNHVVTAAHCLVPGRLPISASDVQIGYGSIDVDHMHFKRAADFFIPATFNLTSMTDDIAVIYSEEPFEFSRNVNSTRIDMSRLKVNTTVYAAGWGVTSPDITDTTPNGLRYTDVRVRSPDDCAKVRSGYNSSDYGVICAANPAEGKDTCFGDSGGPDDDVDSNSSNNTTYLLVGLTSYGDSVNSNSNVTCAVPGVEAFYTHVGYYLPFIFNVTGLSAEDL
ncbi:Kallikrein 1- peptidase b1, partial [Spiromyces aspiralis]